MTASASRSGRTWPSRRSGILRIDPPPAEPTSEPPFLKRLDLPRSPFRRTGPERRRGCHRGRAVGAGQPGDPDGHFPGEFAKTAWFRSDFAKAPLVDYLSLLARHHEGVIVSTKFYNDQKLTLGQELHFVFHEQPFDAYVAGVVDLWPTLDPSRSPFFILNIDYRPGEHPPGALRGLVPARPTTTTSRRWSVTWWSWGCIPPRSATRKP